MKSTSKTKRGTVELPADEFAPKNGKFRVTMFIDLDVLDKIRNMASAEHIGYQTWINHRLREITMSESTIDSRLKKLEQIVLKKFAG